MIISQHHSLITMHNIHNQTYLSHQYTISTHHAICTMHCICTIQSALCSMWLCTMHHTAGGSRKKSGPSLVNTTGPLPSGMTDYYPSHYTCQCLWFQPVHIVHSYYIRLYYIPFYTTGSYGVYHTLHGRLWLPVIYPTCLGCYLSPDRGLMKISRRPLGRARQLFGPAWPLGHPCQLCGRTNERHRRYLEKASRSPETLLSIICWPLDRIT